MNIQDQFRVAVPVQEAWRILLDIERIAPCLPGAQLQEVEAGEYRGIVKVKVGPITAQYKGAARILERDDATRKVVIRAEGRDTRGQGNASATVTAILAPDDEGTTVSITTDLSVTGKVAQFGRGVMAEVSSKLLAQFAHCLHDTVLNESPARGARSSQGPANQPTDATGTRMIHSEDTEAINLVREVSGPLLERLVIVAVGVAGVVALVAWRRVREHRSGRTPARPSWAIRSER